jgi:hypothetical protein
MPSHEWLVGLRRGDMIRVRAVIAKADLVEAVGDRRWGVWRFRIWLDECDLGPLP